MSVLVLMGKTQIYFICQIVIWRPCHSTRLHGLHAKSRSDGENARLLISLSSLQRQYSAMTHPLKFLPTPINAFDKDTNRQECPPLNTHLQYAYSIPTRWLHRGRTKTCACIVRRPVYRRHTKAKASVS